MGVEGVGRGIQLHAAGVVPNDTNLGVPAPGAGGDILEIGLVLVLQLAVRLVKHVLQQNLQFLQTRKACPFVRNRNGARLQTAAFRPQSATARLPQSIWVWVQGGVRPPGSSAARPGRTRERGVEKGGSGASRHTAGCRCGCPQPPTPKTEKPHPALPELDPGELLLERRAALNLVVELGQQHVFDLGVGHLHLEHKGLEHKGDEDVHDDEHHHDVEDHEVDLGRGDGDEHKPEKKWGKKTWINQAQVKRRGSGMSDCKRQSASNKS